MSLYIGNMSAHIRRDELKRVFLRFGHCYVNLKKDGYGFVVYDFPLNAEKALRALQGRHICGELLTLHWSNKQPRPFQRFDRGAKSFELQHGKNTESVGYARRKVDSDGWRDYKMNIRKDSTDGRIKYVDRDNEGPGYHQNGFKDCVGAEQQDYREDLPNEGGKVVANLVDNGRWGEQVDNHLVDNEGQNAMDSDHYEPFHGCDSKYDDENHQAHLGGSPAPQSSRDDEGSGRRATLNHPYDTKLHPRCYRCGNSGHKQYNCPKGRNTSQINSRVDDDIDNRHRNEDGPRKSGLCSWEKVRPGRKGFSRNYRKNNKNVSGSQHHRMLQKKNELCDVAKRSDLNQRNHGSKKRNGKDINPLKKPSVKKLRRSISSSLHHGNPASCSHSRSFSQTSKSIIKSSSHSSSRSVSSRSRSPRSKKSNSHRSLSISASLNQPLPSSPIEIQLNQRGSLDNATSHESLECLIENGQQMECNVMLGDDKSGDAALGFESGNAILDTKVPEESEKVYHLQEDNNENHIPSWLSDEAKNLSLTLPDKHTLPDDVAPISEIEKPISEKDANIISGHSTNIPLDEMYTVLKHYGLELPNDDEKNLTIDAFFGSARLWPWEIIYYRRLKKGAISIENYARRVAQNKEFGIVDKYIRSSSGWGEVCLENP